jgi:hypothetical protein
VSCLVKQGIYLHGTPVTKGRVVPVLFFNGATRREGALGKRTYSFTHSFSSALDGGEWLASRTGRFTPMERAPGTHWIEGWVGRRAGLDAVVKGKIPSPRWESWNEGIVGGNSNLLPQPSGHISLKLLNRFIEEIWCWVS